MRMNVWGVDGPRPPRRRPRHPPRCRRRDSASPSSSWVVGARGIDDHRCIERGFAGGHGRGRGRRAAVAVAAAHDRQSRARKSERSKTKTNHPRESCARGHDGASSVKRGCHPEARTTGHLTPSSASPWRHAPAPASIPAGSRPISSQGARPRPRPRLPDLQDHLPEGLVALHAGARRRPSRAAGRGRRPAAARPREERHEVPLEGARREDLLLERPRRGAWCRESPRACASGARQVQLRLRAAHHPHHHDAPAGREARQVLRDVGPPDELEHHVDPAPARAREDLLRERAAFDDDALLQPQRPRARQLVGRARRPDGARADRRRDLEAPPSRRRSPPRARAPPRPTRGGPARPSRPTPSGRPPAPPRRR